MKILLSLLLVLVTVSCNQPSGDRSPTTPPRNSQDDDYGNSPKFCKTNRVMRILGDKRSVVSHSTENNQILIVWDIQNQQKISTLNSISNLFRFSSAGNYVIKRLSLRRFQLQSTSEGDHTIDLRFSGLVKSLDFSSNSDFVVMAQRKKNYIDEVIAYDVLKKETRFRSTFNNVKFVKMIDEENLYVAHGIRSRNTITKVNTLTGNQEELKIRSGAIRSFNITQNVLLAKIDYRYYGYNLDSGDYLYNRKLKAIYDYDYDSDFAVVLLDDVNTIYLMNMATGELSDPYFGPSDVNLSSCRFTENVNTLMCRSKTMPGKVLLWDINSEDAKAVCY